MKTTRPYLNILVKRKKQIRNFVVFLFLLDFLPIVLVAQCPTGYSSAVINWDNLDYLHSNSTYTSYVTASMRQTQYFAIGTNRLTINTTIPVGSYGTPLLYGDVTEHSGETGSYGTGADVKYVGNGTITLTFQSAVQNVTFSFYDIDYDQRITVTASDGATARNITMTNVSGTVLTITGSGTTSANAKASTTAVATTSSDATVNVSIAGPLTTITISITETNTKTNGPASGQEDGSYFFSDLSACVADPGFPSNYYASYVQPFTGQPSYFLANPQNLHVYMLNTTTAVADYVFSDPGTSGNKMNSLAYDPVNKWLYYVMDNASSPANNKSLKKYDFNTELISTVVSDITTLGIPTFAQGIEFGGAAFYNGSLYFGLEGSDGLNYNTNAESVIWRIDFNSSGVPTQASQVFGIPGDNGLGSPSHDWGDFVIKDGVIVSQAINATNSNHYIHFNMQTAQTTTYAGNAESAGQMGQTWNGDMYRIKNNIGLYNNGVLGSLTTITTTSCSPAWSGNAGDASDPFKPKCDFGDAPSTYDPNSLSPAVHQKACNNSTLRIGSTWDREWTENVSSDASGDGADEDGISTVTMMVSDGIPYNHAQEVTVINSTGSTAYLAGWLDYNANGSFESSEGVVMAVPHSGTTQTVTLSWAGITVPIGTPNSFLRIRLYSGILTTNDVNGWLSDGEVEDYPVISNATLLTIQLLDLNAILTNDKNVLLTWKAYTDDDAYGFEIERSRDQHTWEKIATQEKNPSFPTAEYRFLDQQPLEGRSYYRLKMVEKSGSSKYSSIEWIQLDQPVKKMKLYPNPAKNNFALEFISDESQPVTLQILSVSGQLLMRKSLLVTKGINKIPVDISNLTNGLYVVQLISSGETYINKLSVQD